MSGTLKGKAKSIVEKEQWQNKNLKNLKEGIWGGGFKVRIG
jgi:hypothetical protein